MILTAGDGDPRKVQDVANLNLNLGPLSREFVWPDTPIRKVLIIGHGALATRQAPTYKHWIDNGVEVHCADVESSQLEDCLDGVHRYLLPRDLGALLAKGPFDLVCINNIPEHHLMTALYYGSHAKRIIIQKPQDLNFPLIRDLGLARGFEEFRAKTVIHDHYRNKSAFAALLNALPQKFSEVGRFRRVMFFITEARSVSDEPHRAASLKCGMIQDLAVHQLDLMLECLRSANEWPITSVPGDDRRIKRVSSSVKIMNCVKLRDLTSNLGDDVETCAVIDLTVTEQLQFLFGPPSQPFSHTFEVLVVAGKGLEIEQGTKEDLKSIVLEFELNESYVVVDLSTQQVHGIAAEGINRQHGGMNRPLLLISPDPPDHASQGHGSEISSLWQYLSRAGEVAEIADAAKRWPGPRAGMATYQYHRPLGDLIRDLASPRSNLIRHDIWSGLPSLTSFRITEKKPDVYFD